MNKEIKQKWIDALQSGDYKQCKGRLADNDSFCCLGVLTDLYLKEKNMTWTRVAELPKTADCCIDWNSAPNRCFPGEAVLPQEVQTWAELSTPSPRVPCVEVSKDAPMVDPHSGVCLVHMNDELDFSFEKIAGYIKQSEL